MEWKQLTYFLQVAKEENLSKTAKKLHISQPSLSQTIKRLEEEMGYPLFRREGKHIRLNESGKILMRTVMEMQELMDNTRMKLEELNGVNHPEVSIYIGCASTLLPELLGHLRACAPNVQYRIHQWNGSEEEKVDDIQILAGNPWETKEDVKEEALKGTWEVLLEEDLLLALPAGHPLLQKAKITWEDLSQEEFISLNHHWELTREITREMNRNHFQPKITMWVDNPNLLRELLKAHMGIAFVPAITWHSFAGEEVKMRPVENCRMVRCIYLHTTFGKHLTAEQKQCMRLIREFFVNKKQESNMETE